MAKKKKTQLKPVARGFATTSVAKKVTPDVEDEVNEKSAASTPGADAQAPSTLAGGDPNAGQLGLAGPSLRSEDQQLQSYVDKYQDRVEKDITRTIKAWCFW